MKHIDSNLLNKLLFSRYYIKHLLLNKKCHKLRAFTDDFKQTAPYPSETLFDSSFDTCVAFFQNELASRDWLIDELDINELQSCFK